jgi:hypothetical protein
MRWRGDAWGPPSSRRRWTGAGTGRDQTAAVGAGQPGCRGSRKDGSRLLPRVKSRVLPCGPGAATGFRRPGAAGPGPGRRMPDVPPGGPRPVEIRQARGSRRIHPLGAARRCHQAGLIPGSPRIEANPLSCCARAGPVGRKFPPRSSRGPGARRGTPGPALESRRPGAGSPPGGSDRAADIGRSGRARGAGRGRRQGPRPSPADEAWPDAGRANLANRTMFPDGARSHVRATSASGTRNGPADWRRPARACREGGQNETRGDQKRYSSRT